MYTFYQKVLCFSCMCSEKVILYKKFSVLFFARLKMIFQKATSLKFFSKFHFITFLLKKNISNVFVFENLKKNKYFWVRFEVKKPSWRMALYALVIKLSKRCESCFWKFRCFFLENWLFVNFTFFLAKQIKWNFSKKKFTIIFFLKKLNFRTITITLKGSKTKIWH